MKEINSFRTVKGDSEGKFQSRGSKFFAYLFPIAELARLEEHIQQLKQEHNKARHFCYAYRIIENGTISDYCSDAGEPGGSSGPPILAALKQHELLNTGCVVVRYFGGTKLGIPGLIEAYGNAAREAIENGRIIQHRRTAEVRIDAPMKYQPHLMEAVKRAHFESRDYQYTTRFQMTLCVPVDDKESHILKVLLHLSDRAYEDLKDLAEYLEIELTDLGHRFTEQA